MKKVREKNRKKSGEDNKKLVPIALRCGAAGILVTLLLLLAVAAATARGALSQEMTDDFVVCCVIMGSAVGGFICAKKWGGGVLTAGLSASGVYLLVVLFGSVFTVSGAGETTILLKVIIGSAVGGVFGGVLRLYKKTKKSKLRKKI